MRYKPWSIYVSFNVTNRKEMGVYTNRENAERDASGYRKHLPKTALVEVVWMGEDRHAGQG